MHRAAALNSLETTRKSPVAFDTKQRQRLTHIFGSKRCRFLESDSVANPVCEHEMAGGGGGGGVCGARRRDGVKAD